MINESLFVIQIFVIVIISLICLRVSKEMLIAWIGLQGILANLFVLKQITLFHLNVTCSDVYAVGAFLALNLLQEFYSTDTTRSAIKIAACIQGCFLVMSQFHLLYIPSPVDVTQEAFTKILTAYPRIVAASLFVFYSVQRMDVVIFQALKKTFPALSFSYRNACSLLISQSLDTILFSFMGLYGLVSSVGDVIMLSLTIKIVLILLVTPLTAFLKHFTVKLA